MTGWLAPPRSPAFEAFLTPARRRPELWRLVAGALLAGAIWLLAAAGLLFLATLRTGGEMRPILLAYLASFATLILGLALAARLLQHRGLASLIGPGGLRPHAWLIGAGLVAAIAAASILTNLPGDPPRRQLPIAVWTGWLLLALPALAVQTAAEELAFRGWLMQGLAVRFRSALVWWLLPGLLFGLLHWDPRTYGPNAGLVVLGGAMIGLLLGDVAARLGNLSAAMGMHFANNAVVLLLVAPPSRLDGLSLWIGRVGPDSPAAFRGLLVGDLATTLLAYAAWRLWWHRRGRRLQSQGSGNI